MDAFVLVLYSANLSSTTRFASLLHEYTNVSVSFAFDEARPSAKKTQLFSRHQHYMKLASDTNRSIMVLEDDFEPLPRLKQVWPKVLEFSERGDFDYINLGGVGSGQFEGSKQIFHKHWMWHTHAVIYSRKNRIREKVLLNFTGHFDWELRKTDAYMTEPLILQTNPRTRRQELLRHDYG